MENLLAAGAFGDAGNFSMLDASAICTLGFLEFRLTDLIDWRSHSKLAAYFDRLHAQRPSVSQTVPVAPQ